MNGLYKLCHTNNISIADQISPLVTENITNRPATEIDITNDKELHPLDCILLILKMSNNTSLSNGLVKSEYDEMISFKFV